MANGWLIDTGGIGKDKRLLTCLTGTWFNKYMPLWSCTGDWHIKVLIPTMLVCDADDSSILSFRIRHSHTSISVHYRLWNDNFEIHTAQFFKKIEVARWWFIISPATTQIKLWFAESTKQIHVNRTTSSSRDFNNEQAKIPTKTTPSKATHMADTEDGAATGQFCWPYGNSFLQFTMM